MKRMKQPVALLAPLALATLAMPGVMIGAQARGAPVASPAGDTSSPTSPDAPLATVLAGLAHRFTPAPWHQVRIVRTFTIRISAGGPMMPPNVLVSLPQDGAPAHFKARRMGKCVAWGGIAAVQGGDDNRLLLFMRDQRIISADLDKACSARDFYAGFLFTRTADGQLCVNRDELQARSGAHCRMRRMRALSEVAPGR